VASIKAEADRRAANVPANHQGSSEGWRGDGARGTVVRDVSEQRA
jgi:hypothetical protein